MTIELSHKEVEKLRCLGNTLASEMVPVKEIRDFLAGLEQKVDSPAGKKRNAHKAERKDLYRKKLRAA